MTTDNEAFKVAKEDNEREIAELQAHINSLREAMEWVDRDYGTIGSHSIISEALAETPAQSLKAHDDELIERCAEIADGWIEGENIATDILRLKGE